MTDIKTWCEYVRNHPAKFRFDGLHSRGRSSKSDFFETVSEAAAADERFMSDMQSEDYEGHESEFELAVEQRKDNDSYLSRFCEYAEGHVTHKAWVKAGLTTYPCWDEAPIDGILAVVDFFVADLKEDFIRDWCCSEWDELAASLKDDEEHLFENHPPIAIWCNAGDYEIKLEDVFFLCPSCREPQTVEDLNELYTQQTGYPYFYCGGCGSEMNVGKKEHILDFFNALEITPYPFNKEKSDHWLKLMADRKAWGYNKLELKVGDLVYLKASEEIESNYDGHKWIHWKDEPGDQVRVTDTSDTGISYEYLDGSGFGGISYDKLYGTSNHE